MNEGLQKSGTILEAFFSNSKNVVLQQISSIPGIRFTI
jgi:hypothetical protein